jgi:membrane protein
MTASGSLALIRRAAAEWSSDDAMRLSASLAFYSILSLAPLLVIAVALAGMVFGEEAARGGLVAEMRGLVGDPGAKVVETALANAREPAAGVLATAIGIITLLVGASGVFAELRNAMNIIWKVRLKSSRSFWDMAFRQLVSISMVISVGFLLLVSLIISTALSALGNHLGGLMPGLPALMTTISSTASFLVIAALFALIFRFLPDGRMPWRPIWFGSAITALLFEVGKSAIGIYLGKAAVGSPYGAAGSLVALLVWVYYSALIVFFGAELTQVNARQRGARLVLIPGAEFSSNERIPEADDPGRQHHGNNGDEPDRLQEQLQPGGPVRA